MTKGMNELRPATRAHVAAFVLLELAAARAVLDLRDESRSPEVRERARVKACHAADQIERILARVNLPQALNEEVRRQLDELRDRLEPSPKADVIDLNSQRASAAG